MQQAAHDEQMYFAVRLFAKAVKRCSIALWDRVSNRVLYHCEVAIRRIKRTVMKYVE